MPYHLCADVGGNYYTGLRINPRKRAWCLLLTPLQSCYVCSKNFLALHAADRTFACSVLKHECNLSMSIKHLVKMGKGIKV